MNTRERCRAAFRFASQFFMTRSKLGFMLAAHALVLLTSLALSAASAAAADCEASPA